MSNHLPLNTTTAVALSEVIRFAQTNARVAYLHDGEVIEGIARHIVKSPDDIGFLTQMDDVRDAYLRVTLVSGFEVFLPITDCIRMVAFGEMVAR